MFILGAFIPSLWFGPTGRLRACLRRPTVVNYRRRRGARYIIAAAPMFCSRVRKLCGRKRDSVANSGVIAFSAGIVSRPVREAPSHFHAYLRGLGLLPGSSPSLDKILGGKCLFGPNSSRVFGVGGWVFVCVRVRAGARVCACVVRVLCLCCACVRYARARECVGYPRRRACSPFHTLQVLDVHPFAPYMI